MTFGPFTIKVASFAGGTDLVSTIIGGKTEIAQVVAIDRMQPRTTRYDKIWDILAVSGLGCSGDTNVGRGGENVAIRALVTPAPN